MGLRISTNMAALSAQRALTKTTNDQAKSYERLASGQRITSAADDAAGLSIAENMRAQIRSIGQAERNASDGISFVQVAEGGMSEIGNIMIRLRELSIQAASDTVGDRERGFIDKEFQSLVHEVDRISNSTNFNGTPLLNGQSSKDELEFQVGPRNDVADHISWNVKQNDVRSESLGLEGASSLTISDARESLDKIDSALGKVNEARAGLGAMQNKLHSTVNTLQVAKENYSQARSRIADADFAEETSKMVKDNILQTAGVAVLAQANQNPMQTLKLL